MHASKQGRASIRGNSAEMVWRDQDPSATDVLLDFTVPFSGGGTPAYLVIDKLPEGALPGNSGDAICVPGALPDGQP